LTAKIVSWRLGCKPGPAEKHRYRLCLPVAQFDRHETISRKQPFALLGKGAIAVQPVWPTVKGRKRIELAHFAGERRDFRAWNIRRVCDNDIEGAAQRRAIIASHERCA